MLIKVILCGGGYILYFLGYPPFFEMSEKKLFEKILAADYSFHPDCWGGVSSEAIDLIKGLVRK